MFGWNLDDRSLPRLPQKGAALTFSMGKIELRVLYFEGCAHPGVAKISDQFDDF